MSKFEITAPDGKKYEITAPEGATEEDALKHFQAQFSQQSTQPENKNPYVDKVKNESTLRRAALGAGGGIYGMYLGAKQMLNQATPEELALHKQKMDALRSTTSGTLGEIGGQIMAGVPTAFIPGAGTYAGAGLIGSAMGALQPTEAEGQRGGNMLSGAIGGVAGNAIGRGIGKLLKPVPRLPSASRDDAIRTAESIGMKLTPGDKTGSLALQQAESVLARTPGSAGMFSRFKDTNQKAINKIAAKTIGENADELSHDVIARASDRISKTFNDLSAKSNVSLSNDFSDLVKNLKDSNATLGPFRNPQVDDLVTKSEELIKMHTIPGNVYQTIRSELTGSADDAYRSGNSRAGKALKDIRNALDDAAKKGLDETDQKLWDNVRSQYAHLSTLVKGNVIDAGNVNPNLIKNAQIKFNAKMYKSGKNTSDLSKIGNVAENFKQMIPNSGTAERSYMQDMMFNNPFSGLPLTALANLYGKAYLSRPGQAYMNKGMVDLSPQLQDLLARSGMLTGTSLGVNSNK